LKLEGHDVTVDARVRHVRQFRVRDEPIRYLVGVEFLSIPRRSPGRQDRFSTAWGGLRPWKVFPVSGSASIPPDFLRILQRGRC
jgi:hypothetical protein